MLDQVKSGTAARIATTRSASGTAPAGEAVRHDHEVLPASAGEGPEGELPHPHTPERRSGEDRRRKDEESRQAPDERIGSGRRREDETPAGARAREMMDAALGDLLKEAAELRARAPRTEAGRGAVLLDIHLRATGAYAVLENLDGRARVLRPGAVFSARF